MIKVDGFDDAIIGIEYHSDRLVYSMRKMIEIELEATEWDEDDRDPEDDPWTEVYEHLSFNVWGAYIGEDDPIYVNDLTDLEDLDDEQK